MHGADHNVLSFALSAEPDTLALGAALAQAVSLRAKLANNGTALVVTLEGELGAGKTTLVRGMLQGLGYQGRVKSPTYTLVEVHAVSELNFYHFDFYRFNQPEEYLEAGLDEYFASKGVCLVEWPDKAGEYLPAIDLRVVLELDKDGRVARLSAGSEQGKQCLTKLVFPAAIS